MTEPQDVLAEALHEIEGLTSWPRVQFFAYDAQIRGVPVNPIEDRVVVDRDAVLAIFQRLSAALVRTPETLDVAAVRDALNTVFPWKVAREDAESVARALAATPSPETLDVEQLAMAMHQARNHRGTDAAHEAVPHPHTLDTSMAAEIAAAYVASPTPPEGRRAAQWLVDIHADDVSIPRGSALWEDLQSLKDALAASPAPDPGAETETETRPCPACGAALKVARPGDTHWSLFAGIAGGYVCLVPSAEPPETVNLPLEDQPPVPGGTTAIRDGKYVREPRPPETT